MDTSKGSKLKFAIAGALMLAAASAFAGQITLYEHPAFEGESLTTTIALPNLEQTAFNDVAASVVVRDGRWEACTEANFRGRCAQLVPGSYSKLDRDLSGPVASVRQVSYEPGAEHIVVSPDSAPVAAAAALPVVINPGAAPVVINPAPAPVVINPAPAPVVVNPAPAPVVVSEPQQVVVAPSVVSAVPVPAGARVTLYQHTGHLVRAVELTSNIDDLDTRNFADSADAALVSGGIWRLCDGEHGRGNCTEFSPGRYQSLGALDGKIRSAYLIAPVPERVAGAAVVPAGRAVLYEFRNFGGPSAVVEYGRAPDLDWAHFRNPASSARIESGSWLVCSEIGYQGECQVLDPGDYPVLTGLGQGIASARQVWRPEYGALNLYHRH